MADVSHFITKGIGRTGGVPFFIRFGLDARPITGQIALTLQPRSVALTLSSRSVGLALQSRSQALTLKDDPR